MDSGYVYSKLYEEFPVSTAVTVYLRKVRDAQNL